MLIIGYEDDGRYIGVLHGVLDELGIAGSWVPTPEFLASKVSATSEEVIIVLDCGVLAAYEPARLYRIVEEIRVLPNVRHILLSSGLVTEEECRRAGLLSAGVSFADKVSVDWYGVISAIAAGPTLSVGPSARTDTLAREWQSLADPAATGDGPRLEAAFRELVIADGTFDLLPDIHTEAAQIDFVLIPRLPAHELPRREFVFVECRNRREKVSAAHVRVIASVMEDIGASLGLIVSRAPLTGSRTTAANGVVLGQWRKHERVIVRLSFDDCISIAHGRGTLYHAVQEKRNRLCLMASGS